MLRRYASYGNLFLEIAACAMTTMFNVSMVKMSAMGIYFWRLRRRRSACRDARNRGGYGDLCRNIRTLFNFDPPTTEDEIRAASLQYVRKISGFTRPSKANEPAFEAAVAEIARVSSELLGLLESNAAPKSREEEAARARARGAQRYGPSRQEVR